MPSLTSTAPFDKGRTLVTLVSGSTVIATPGGSIRIGGACCWAAATAAAAIAAGIHPTMHGRSTVFI
jgi:hypothetical protein